MVVGPKNVAISLGKFQKRNWDFDTIPSSINPLGSKCANGGRYVEEKKNEE